MIIRWVRNLEQAAKDREVAQRSLDGERLTPAEQKRVEEQVSKSNREIERYAQRINDDLKRAAEKREPIRYPRNLDSIHDRQLKDYLASVKSTIHKLNYQLQIDGRQTDMYARHLEARRKEAVKVQVASGKNQTTLKREDAKLVRRRKEVERRLESYRTDLTKIERRLTEIEKERRKIDQESQRVQDISEKKKLELQSGETELRTLDSQRKNEPNRDRRDAIIARIQNLEPQVEQLRQFVNQTLKFQLDQLNQIRGKSQHEGTEMRSAAETAREDIRTIQQELADIDHARKDLGRNLQKEEDRMAAIKESMTALGRTQKYAKKYGVVAT